MTPQNFYPLKVITFSAFITLSGCENTKMVDNIILEYHDNGKVKREKVIIDSVKHSILVYYEDGMLKDSLTFENGKLNGVSRSYDKRDKTTLMVEFKLGKEHGVEKAYFENGTLYYYGLNEEEKQIGEWLFYHPNGTIHTYEYFNPSGERVYLRKYDTEGRLISQMGDALIYLAISHSDTLKLGDTLKYKAYIAKPPHCIVKVITKDNEVISSSHEQIIYQENHISDEKIFLSPGKKVVTVSWEIRDTLMNTTEQGKQLFNFSVVE
jgi:hypothetical protein